MQISTPSSERLELIVVKQCCPGWSWWHYLPVYPVSTLPCFLFRKVSSDSAVCLKWEQGCVSGFLFSVSDGFPKLWPPSGFHPAHAPAKHPLLPSHYQLQTTYITNVFKVSSFKFNSLRFCFYFAVKKLLCTRALVLTKMKLILAYIMQSDN